MLKANVVFKNELITNNNLRTQISLLLNIFVKINISDKDVIAIFLPNSVELLESIGASMVFGNNYCPINYRLTPSEVSYLLEDSQAKVLITNRIGYTKIKAIVSSDLIVILTDEERDGVQHFHHYYKVDNTATNLSLNSFNGYLGTHMPYTSGTTGQPKGILRNKKKWENLGTEVPPIINQALGIEEGGKALLPAPLYHSATNTFIQNALLYSDLVVLMDKFDAEEVLTLIQEYKITVAYLVPTMFKRMLDLPLEIRSNYDISSLKFIASTGSACPLEVKEQMIQWFGPIVHECYASSETGFLTLLTSEEALRKPKSVGKALGNAEIRIRSQGVWAKPGEQGLIYAKQPIYEDFTYQNNSLAREAIECDGLITVGDIGYVDEEGYLYVTDRESDMVISGGVNIYPAEVEQLIHHHNDIDDTAVFGMPDDDFGEALVCLIKLKTGRSLDKSGFKTFLQKNLTGYKIPKKIAIVDELPREETGKLFKKKLQKLVSDNSITFI